MHYSFDYVVVGSGLAGGIIALGLERAGYRVAVLEAHDVLGGQSRAISFGGTQIENGLRLLPETDEGAAAARFLSEFIGGDFEFHSVVNRPRTFSQHEFHDFLGFGDHPPKFYDEVNYFLSEGRLEGNRPFFEIPQICWSQFRGTVLKQNIVTQFGFDQGEDKDSVRSSGRARVLHALVNGAKPIEAKGFIYTGPLRDLGLLLPRSLFSPKQLTRLSKDSFWSALTLDLHHAVDVNEDSNLFLLDGTTHDEYGPCVGRFLRPDLSQWLGFVSSEFTEDSEYVGHVLKKMKRQIQRAFPEVLTHLKGERIVLSSNVSGGKEFRINNQGQIPQVENLWIASSGAGKELNLVGSLLQSQKIIESICQDLQICTKEQRNENLETPISNILSDIGSL